jgi:hypothetical protein
MNFATFTEDPKAHCPSPEDVMRAARDNPYRSQCNGLRRTGKCTWEEALAAAVVSLIDHIWHNPLSRQKSNRDMTTGIPRPDQVR